MKNIIIMTMIGIPIITGDLGRAMITFMRYYSLYLSELGIAMMSIMRIR